jgi:hypothetical protein
MEVPKVMMQIDSTHENQHNFSSQSKNAYGVTFGFNRDRDEPKIDFTLISPEKTKNLVPDRTSSFTESVRSHNFITLPTRLFERGSAGKTYIEKGFYIEQQVVHSVSFLGK